MIMLTTFITPAALKAVFERRKPVQASAMTAL
jgi:hypothetical protein